MHLKPTTSSKGFSLVEAILSVALFALLVTALVGAWLYGEEATQLSGTRNRAVFIAEEGSEALRNMRDTSFASFTPGTYGMSRSTMWGFSGTSDVTDIFTRAVQIASPSFHRRIATTTVSWQQNQQRQGQTAVVSLFSNWIRSWQTPATTATLNLAGAQDGWRIKIQGDYAYLIRDDTTSDFVVINISNPSAPTVVGSLTLPGQLYDIAVEGSYAYVVSSSDAQEFQVVSIATPTAPSLVASLNMTGGANGTSVSISGGHAYVTRAGTPDFSIVSIITPTAPVVLGTLTITGTVFDTVRVGSYVYAGTSSGTQEIQIINVTNPAAPSIAASYNMTGTDEATALTAFDTTLVVGRDSDSAVVLLSLANPTIPAVLGSLLHDQGTVYEFALGGDKATLFAATDDGGDFEFKVIDIYNPATPTLIGNINAPGDHYGVAYDPIRDRAYVVGASNAQELAVYASTP